MFDYFPKWGPYSKKYAGVSRIIRHGEIDGARFDVCVAPAVSGFDIRVPTSSTNFRPFSRVSSCSSQSAISTFSDV